MESGHEASGATRTEAEAAGESPFENGIAWRAGGGAGIVATVVMGVFIMLIDLPTLRTAIAGLYGFEGSLVVGWGAHVAHGAIFGLLFAVVLADPSLYRIQESLSRTVAAGVVYGLVLAVAGAGIIMPIWLGLVGFPTPPSLPFVTPATVSWHVVYGAVLGGVYAFVASRWPTLGGA